jgi:membrane-bound metal-dependent hydrolase YbcI (DUF457 family)
MTARTHDLFAATCATLAIVFHVVPDITVATALIATGALFLGGLAPDLDESTSALWQRLPAGSGSIAGKVVAPVFGSHRFISHSLLGAWLFSKLVWLLLSWSKSWLLVDSLVVHHAFVLGFASHLFADSLTHEGIPILFPLTWKVGIPPIKFLRIKTGGWREKLVVFPGLVLFNIYLIYSNYQVFIGFFTHLKQ